MDKNKPIYTFTYTINPLAYRLNQSYQNSIQITMPLAEYESIDLKVEKMSEFPEVSEILKKVK